MLRRLCDCCVGRCVLSLLLALALLLTSEAWAGEVSWNAGSIGCRSTKPLWAPESCGLDTGAAEASGLQRTCAGRAMCGADAAADCCHPPNGRQACDDSFGDFCNFRGACDTAKRRGGSRPTLFAWTARSSGEGGPPRRNEPLATDRPDFTEASVTVGRGVGQIEAGYTYVVDGNGGERVETHSVGEPLLRVGLFADWFELRVAWSFIDETTHRADGTVEHASGGTDVILGVKLALTPQDGVLPETALIAQMTVPSGADAFGADDVGPGLIWIYGWELSDRLSTAGSTQGNRVTDGDTEGGYLEISQSWTVGLSLTERLGCYAEWFAMFPHAADTERPRHFTDGGFTYLVSNDCQLDIRAGVGLNDAADDFFAGSGLSIRF